MGKSVAAVALLAVLVAGLLSHGVPAPFNPSSPSFGTWDGVGDLPSGLPPDSAVVLGASAFFAILVASLPRPRVIALSPSTRERGPPAA